MQEIDIKETKALVENIAQRVKSAGGETYYVGGMVRDSLLQRETMDMDIEVHGVTPETLYTILEDINAGEIRSVGKNFGVYNISGYDVDIAMPRLERSIGRGHKDFEVYVDPFAGTEAAGRRRDFTINAMMRNVLTGELIDHFGGERDLQNKLIKCVSDTTMIEDPLRVLRAAQFAARLGFKVGPETLELCKKADLSSLSKERVYSETMKALMSDKPSVFFETLREANQLGVWFPEFKALIGVKQPQEYHPEGDAWAHTMLTIDSAAKLRGFAEKPEAFMLSALCYDLGKAVSTIELNGKISAHQHAENGEFEDEIRYYQDEGQR